MTSTYASPEYAVSLNPGAKTLFVAELDTSIIVRAIPNTNLVDAIGPYPFTKVKSTASKSKTRAFLNDHNIVALVLVTDPFTHETEDLYSLFDIVHRFKNHYIVDPNPHHRYSKHHRYEIRKSLRSCSVRRIALHDYLDDWSSLYAELSKRHNFNDQHRFPNSYFEKISEMPEFIAIGAFIGGELASCNIWLLNNGTVYNHLGASSQLGYEHNCSYAVYDFAIRNFHDCTAIDLGGVPDNPSYQSNLGFFKKGFSNRMRPTLLCGLVADQKNYLRLSKQRESQLGMSTMFFPMYRAPYFSS